MTHIEVMTVMAAHSSSRGSDPAMKYSSGLSVHGLAGLLNSFNPSCRFRVNLLAVTSWTSLPTEEAFITLRALGRVALTASESRWLVWGSVLMGVWRA